MVKMTYKRKKYMYILAYLYFFPGNEGLGGKCDTRDSSGYCIGDWVVGTRLRHPSGPLYNMYKDNRARIMKELVDKRCLEITLAETEETLAEYRVTEYGLSILKRSNFRLIKYVAWYKHPSGAWHSENEKFIYADPVWFCQAHREIQGGNSGISIGKVYEY